jgi:hypothetical protein
MTIDERLRGADPAADLDAKPPDELLERIVALAPDPARRRRAPLLIPAAVLVAAATAAALVSGGSGAPDLVARAYAATSDEERIVHSRVRVVEAWEGEDAPRRAQTGVEEQWLYGDRAHSIVTTGDWTSHNVLRADGTILLVDDSGREEVIRPGDGREARQVVEGARKGFVAAFRERYESRQLSERGTTTFAGREVRRYVVRDGAGPDLEEYYVDLATGEPAGALNRYATDGVGANGRPTPGVASTTTVVETFERLEPTAENLRRLDR